MSGDGRRPRRLPSQAPPRAPHPVIPVPPLPRDRRPVEGEGGTYRVEIMWVVSASDDVNAVPPEALESAHAVTGYMDAALTEREVDGDLPKAEFERDAAPGPADTVVTASVSFLAWDHSDARAVRDALLNHAETVVGPEQESGLDANLFYLTTDGEGGWLEAID